MRAPEMATGAWRAVVERVAEVHAVDLVRHLDGVGDADRVAILGAWGSGKAHIVYLATIKFGFWGKLPHRLCGLARPDAGVVAQMAEYCFATV
jgi:hypothetical protein